MASAQLNWRLVFLIQWEQNFTSSRMVHLPTPPNWPLTGWKHTSTTESSVERQTSNGPHTVLISAPPIFSCGATWRIGSTKQTLKLLVSWKETSKQRWKPLTKQPAALWCPTSSAAWRCVSIRKEDIWSNCCRTGYTPVRVLIFYVTVFILIKSIFLNFCFILSIFVIVGFFLNNFQKRQPQFFLLWINSYNFFVWRPKLIKIDESLE